MTVVKRYATDSDCYKANVNKSDSRYTTFQERGPSGLMLHSVGCAQPSGEVFAKLWNKPNYQVCPHAAIDANTGVVYQTLPWNYRGWHAGTSLCNNAYVGVEMCESSKINYTRYDKFEIIDKQKAQRDCECAYNSAVELFADLCKKFSINPLTGIISHNEGGKRGIASNHTDPEHYWTGLDMSYTMDGFRAAVKAKIVAAEDTIKKPIRIVTGAFNSTEYAKLYLKEVNSCFPGSYPVDGDWRAIQL